MNYAVYIKTTSNEEDLSIMNSVELEDMMISFLKDQAEIEESLLDDLNTEELIQLFEDTLQEGVDYDDTDRMLVVDARNNTIIDVDRNF